MTVKQCVSLSSFVGGIFRAYQKTVSDQRLFCFSNGRNFNYFSYQWFLSVDLDSSRQKKKKGILKCGITVAKSQCNCPC